MQEAALSPAGSVNIRLTESPQPDAPLLVPAARPIMDLAEDGEAVENIEEAAENAGEVSVVFQEAGGAMSVGEYATRNYSYIQRRIRDKLVYPREAQRAGMQGTTEVGFTIHEDGSISSVVVRIGSGHAILDQGAVAAVFAAAPLPKPAAPARIAIPVAFSLR
jgi:protein TonB